MRNEKTKRRKIGTVSYTHLDVYKRQIQGITKKLLLLYTGPFTITKDKENNTYEVTDTINNKIKVHIIKRR